MALLDQEMETRQCSSSSTTSLSSAPPSRQFSALCSTVSFNLLYATLALVLAIVGTTLGATIGALLGMKTRTGFLHGAAFGAINGCILSIKISRASFILLDSDDVSIESLVAPIETSLTLLKEKFVEEIRHSQLIMQTREQQMNVQANVDQIEHNYERRRCISTMRLSNYLKNRRLPVIKLTKQNAEETLWNGPSCAVCLRDFELEEKICSLPQCRHTFHVTCIGKWLIRHSSCPLCRTNL